MLDTLTFFTVLFVFWWRRWRSRRRTPWIWRRWRRRSITHCRRWSLQNQRSGKIRSGRKTGSWWHRPDGEVGWFLLSDVGFWTQRMTDLFNEWMSDEGVCRTAPATPGLLNIGIAALGQTKPFLGERSAGVNPKCQIDLIICESSFPFPPTLYWKTVELKRVFFVAWAPLPLQVRMIWQK